MTFFRKIKSISFNFNFVSPLVKRIVIISNKQGIYELLHDVLNHVRRRTLGVWEMSRRPEYFIK